MPPWHQASIRQTAAGTESCSPYPKPHHLTVPILLLLSVSLPPLVLLLKSGEIVYQGKADRALEFFAKAGFPCPDQTNPADHLLDVITVRLN